MHGLPRTLSSTYLSTRSAIAPCQNRQDGFTLTDARDNARVKHIDGPIFDTFALARRSMLGHSYVLTHFA
ncbi:hypothetical protein CERSUDRAFT_127734 [Gelatoporia subvermispora B]|uniref:Uncharacterized protein n=1 Tax=Ceriporiopsis subvermispora (strain B) TaxID=914234 RepID=M2QWB8_CERS8|nr:hypothetical protein CERSUDRAFT_127734 [Gelatoporia subvermispora B]